VNFEYTDAIGNALSMDLLREDDGTISGAFGIIDQHEESEFVRLNQGQLASLRDELIKAIGPGGRT
jgi:hypothetical protein